MTTVFLGEKMTAGTDSAVKGTVSKTEGLGSNANGHGSITNWLEIWDYPGGNQFRGFLFDGRIGRSLFVFFDDGVYGKELKQG